MRAIKRYLFLFIFLAQGLSPFRLSFAEPHNWGKGPLGLYTQYPYSALHLSLPAESPQVLSAAEHALSLQNAWSNTSVLDDHFVVDDESAEILLSYRAGLGSDLEGALQVPLLWRGGGVLDSLIDNWHEFFSLPRGDRRNLEIDDFDLSGEGKGGSSYDFEQRGTEWGNVKVGLKYLIDRGSQGKPAFTYAIKASLPTSSSEFGHEGVDLGQSLLSSLRMDQTILYAGVSYIYFSEPDVSDLTYYRNHFEGFFSAEYEYSEALSLLLGTSLSSGVVKDVIGHPEISVYLDLGVKYALAQSLLLNLGLRENPFPGNGTTDVSFVLGMEWYFGA